MRANGAIDEVCSALRVNGVGQRAVLSKRANVNQQFAHVVQHSARDHSRAQSASRGPNPKTKDSPHSFAFAAADDEPFTARTSGPETRPP